MPPWVWVLVGSGGVITTVITATAALIRQSMNLTFYRHALDTHGIEGLNAARRAVHPFTKAIRARWRRRAMEKKPPPRTAIQPSRPTLPLPRESAPD